MKKPIHKHLLLAALAAMIPASLYAQNTLTIGFNTDANLEGFTGTNVAAVPALTTSGGLLTGTATTGDPRIIKGSSTPIVSKPATASWQTAIFRVRETADPLTPGTVVNTFDPQGLLVGLNSTNSATGVTSALSYSAGAIDVDGFFTVTANISNFSANDILYLRVDPIGGTDATNNKFEVDYIEITRSNTLPTLLSTNPADGATGVAPSANFVATFDEPVFLNTTGSITIKNLTTGSDKVISVGGLDVDGSLSVLGNVLTIDPSVNPGLAGHELSIEISADAIKDADGGFYAGILNTSVPNWSFTLDNIPPAPSYFHPIPATAKAPLDGLLFIGFNEDVIKGAGNIVLHRADNTVVETINVTSANVSVSGARVAITPTVALAYGTSYYVLIDSGAFTDSFTNPYAGISSPSVWAFSTIASDPKILFGDSFNRNDGTDPDASAIGKYGSLGALTYTSRLIGVGNVELSSGQLLLESNENNGNSGALVYLDHNFTDAAISTAGGFSITVDLNAYTTAGTTRFMSVAVGQSSVELDAQTTTSVTAATVADLTVGYRGTNSTLEIRKNGGTPIVVSSLPAAPTKMRIDYAHSNFNTGSTVNYSVFFDESVTAFTTGSFTWSGTNENYISLSSNLLQTFTVGERHSLFDNLQIRTLGGSGFDTWKTTNSATGQNPGDDHDGDGVSNGIEYFIGGPNTITTGFNQLPGVTSGSPLSVTWTKAGTYTGTYGPGGFEVQISSTLATGSWSAASTSGTPNVDNTVYIDTINNTVTYTFPAGTKNFARLKVTGP